MSRVAFDAWYKEALGKGKKSEWTFEKEAPPEPNVLELFDNFDRRLIWITPDMKLEVNPEVKTDAASEFLKIVADSMGDRDRAQQLRIRSALIYAIPALKLLANKVQDQDLREEDKETIKQAITRAEEIFK